ncbi:hypothetical protein ABK040_015620 [Willaertia magna]
MSKYSWQPKICDFKTEQSDIKNQYLQGLINLGSSNSNNEHPLSPLFGVNISSTTVATNAINKQKKIVTPSTPSFNDPLRSPSTPTGESYSDPLRSSSFSDPLSTPTTPTTSSKQQQPTLNFGHLNRQIGAKQKPGYLNWNIKKQAYLKKYTTDKNIPVFSNILEEEEGENKNQTMTLQERLKMRLEELQKEDKDQDTQYMAQKDYIKHLEKLNEELKDAWNVQNDRVKSLKVIIRCSKILGRNVVPQFYPSMFILVSEVLDTFGKLVFNRLREKASRVDPSTGKVISKLPRDFSSHDVTEDSKEVCRNWFYKIASIRELLGRIYIEMSLLSCYKFLFDGDDNLAKHFIRLAKEIRGIGDPLIAAYARCYLARKGFELLPDHGKEYLMILLDDTIITQQQLDDEYFQKFLVKVGLTKEQYLDLFRPAFDWMLEVLGKDTNESLFHQVMDRYQKQGKQNAIILNSIISSFEPHIISSAASLLIYEIKECNESTLPRYVLFRSLGEQFCVCPPEDAQKLDLLNEIWKHVTAIKDLSQYAPIAEVFVEFVCKSFTLKEVNILLKDFQLHMKESGLTSFESIENEIQNILLTILENTADFVTVFNMPFFLPLFDLLKTNRKAEVSKGMLKAFGKRKKAIQADPVIINSLYDLAITLHDSVTALSEDSVKEEVSGILVGFINNIDFGMALEKELNFYVDCRRVFSMFDRVKEVLIFKTLTMIAKTYKIVKGQHTAKTSSFIKACVSFCHITIPSLQDLFKRVKLFVLTGQYSVMNNLLPQADAVFKAAIEVIKTIPRIQTLTDNTVIDNTEELISIINWIESCFISVPGHPEQGPFYLMRGLLNLIQEYDWGHGSDAKVRLFIHTLTSLFAFAQSNLPYTYAGVTSNDELYMEDDDYKTQLTQIGNTIIEKTLEEMATLTQDDDITAKKKQSQCAAELLGSIVFYSQLNPQLVDLIVKLYKLALSNGDEKTVKFLENIKKDIQSIANLTDQQLPLGFSTKDPILKKQLKVTKQQFQAIAQMLQ